MGEPYVLNCTAACVMGPLISPANPLQILAHCQAVMGTQGPELQRHEVPAVRESAEGQSCPESLWSLIASLCPVKATVTHRMTLVPTCHPDQCPASHLERQRHLDRDPQGLWETTFSALSTPCPHAFLFCHESHREDFDAQGASEIRQSQGPDLLTKPLTSPGPLALNQDRSPWCVIFSTFVSQCLVRSF